MRGRTPTRVASLVYLSGTGLGDGKSAYRAERARRTTEEQRARLAALKEKGTDRSAEEEREFRTLAWFTDHADRARAWRWAREDAAAPFTIDHDANRRLGAETDSWSDDDVRARCRRLSTPVTVVHDGGDPRPAAAAAAMAEALPHSVFRPVPDAGRHPWREHPAAVSRLLRSALRAP